MNKPKQKSRYNPEADRDMAEAVLDEIINGDTYKNGVCEIDYTEAN